MGAIGKKCCDPDPPNCESACESVPPVTTATFTSPENGDVEFTFPTSAVFDCRTDAESECLFGDWQVIYDQACEQDWPSVDPTAGRYIGQVLGSTYGATVPECDCNLGYGTTRHPYKFWYVQGQRALRNRTWARVVWRWFLSIVPNGISGQLRIELTLRLVVERVNAQSVGYRERWKSMTAECETFVTAGGLTATQLVVSEIGDWITQAAISPLPEPPFCFWKLGDGISPPLVDCDETSTPPSAYPCDLSIDEIGLAGNQGCDSGDVGSIRAVYAPNCNSAPGYPAFDVTTCIDSSYRAYAPTNQSSRAMGFYKWFSLVDCDALRDAPITLTLPSPPSGNIVTIVGILLESFGLGESGCEFASTIDAPITISIPTTLTVEFA